MMETLSAHFMRNKSFYLATKRVSIIPVYCDDEYISSHFYCLLRFLRKQQPSLLQEKTKRWEVWFNKFTLKLTNSIYLFLFIWELIVFLGLQFREINKSQYSPFLLEESAWRNCTWSFEALKEPISDITWIWRSPKKRTREYAISTEDIIELLNREITLKCTRKKGTLKCLNYMRMWK